VLLHPVPASAVPAPSLAPLAALVAEDLAAMDMAIQAALDSQAPLIPKLARHIIEAGGKRIRPMLTLACARLCGYAGDHPIKLAACVEYIHTATLLHDDVVDDSSLRRGRPSANALWGNTASVLVGDFLFARAFELMVDCGSLPVLDILARASSRIAEGEVLQLAATRNLHITTEHSLAIIRGKTAGLFAAACQVAGALAEVPAAAEQALADFGLHLGIAFQLTDDALDYDADQAQLGKHVGDDFREGKVTLPVIHAFQAGDATERAFWLRTMGQVQQTEEDLSHAVTLMHRHGALTATLAQALTSCQQAEQCLLIFPDSPARQALQAAVGFVAARGY
jgi:octaprenyl-diphosphate synthase